MTRHRHPAGDLTHGPIKDPTVTVEGPTDTQDTGGVLKGTDERFPAKAASEGR